MGFFGFLTSVVAFFFVLIALIPFLGWLNWFVLPVSILGFVMSLIGVIQRRVFVLAVFGVIIGAAAILMGITRLIIGFGIF